MGRVYRTSKRKNWGKCHCDSSDRLSILKHAFIIYTMFTQNINHWNVFIFHMDVTFQKVWCTPV